MSWQVPSLESCLKLKELGLDQTVNPGDYYWVKIRQGWKCFLQSEQEDNVSTTPFEFCKAFSVAELGAMLPDNTDTHRYNNEYNCEAHTLEDYKLIYSLWGKTEAEARAKMVIYLITKEGIQPRKI